MVAAFDIGNSNLHVGIFNNDLLVKKKAFPHDAVSNMWLKEILKVYQIKDTAISSVVPDLTKFYQKLIYSSTGKKPMVINHKLELKLKIGYLRPVELGTDRIAAMVAARSLYQRDLIVVNFGTATILDLVFKNGYHPGGIIMTGIQSGIKALANSAARLRNFRIQWPRDILGKTTRDCVQCGGLAGTAAMIKCLIAMIQRKYDRNFYKIATGGWAKKIYGNTSIFDCYEPDLVLYGINKIYQYNGR